MAFKPLHVIFAILLVIMFINSSLSAQHEVQELRNNSTDPNYMLARRWMTCNRYPRVCRSRGSQGPDCCNRRCVNVLIDEHNCGRCGKRCKYWETCCRGKCVNVYADEKNCGRCYNRCKKGNSCQHGLCSYA